MCRIERKNRTRISVGKHNVEEVEGFRYMGTRITTNGNKSLNDTKQRTAHRK